MTGQLKFNAACCLKLFNGLALVIKLVTDSLSTINAVLLVTLLPEQCSSCE